MFLFQHWQSLVAGLLVLFAVAFVARRVRRAFLAATGKSGTGVGCGSCVKNDPAATGPPRPAEKQIVSMNDLGRPAARRDDASSSTPE